MLSPFRINGHAPVLIFLQRVSGPQIGTSLNTVEISDLALGNREGGEAGTSQDSWLTLASLP